MTPLLADAYNRSDILKKAIINLEKAAALNPRISDAADRLKALREK
jgi:hypothetical protein